jgi:hypothetical protein
MEVEEQRVLQQHADEMVHFLWAVQLYLKDFVFNENTSCRTQVSCTFKYLVSKKIFSHNRRYDGD